MIIDVKGLPPEAFEMKLNDLSKIYSKVTMSINEYCHLLSAPGIINESKFTPVIDREILRTGHYGTIEEMKIFVTKNMKSGEIEV